MHTGTKINDRRLTRKSLVGHFTTVGSHYRLDDKGRNGGFVLDLPEDDNLRAHERTLRSIAQRALARVRRAYWSLRGRVRRAAAPRRKR